MKLVGLFWPLDTRRRHGSVMDCAGKAQRRRRFRPLGKQTIKRMHSPHESGVALRFPPQSMTRWNWRCWRLSFEISLELRFGVFERTR
jgi:hypothetical protein